MPRLRTYLQTLLEDTLGSRNVYFQPPESLKLSYPAIVYKLSDISTSFANNDPYLRDKIYQITLIDFSPDSSIAEKIAKLPMCKFKSCFTANNLNHFVFTITF